MGVANSFGTGRAILIGTYADLIADNTITDNPNTGLLGFENTYALAMREDVAERLGLRTISDLARHQMLGGPYGSPQPPPARSLRAAFTSGFLERDDG